MPPCGWETLLALVFHTSGGSTGTAGLLAGRLCQKHPHLGGGVPLCFSRPSKVSSGLMHVLSPRGHSPGELALIIGFTETQTGLPLSTVGPWRPPWFPRRHGAVVLPAALCHYEALTWISSDYGWNFLRSPKLFLESNYSSKLLIHVSISWLRNKSIWLKNIFLKQSAKNLFPEKWVCCRRVKGVSLSPSVSSQKAGAHHVPSGCAQVTVW